MIKKKDLIENYHEDVVTWGTKDGLYYISTARVPGAQYYPHIRTGNGWHRLEGFNTLEEAIDYLNQGVNI
jgi:hypothetical protein